MDFSWFLFQSFARVIGLLSRPVGTHSHSNCDISPLALVNIDQYGPSGRFCRSNEKLAY